MDLTVGYEKKGERLTIELDADYTDDIEVNYTNIPEEERGGLAKQLLGSSVLTCFCGAFAKALEARGANYDKVTGTATVTAGYDDQKRSRITAIAVEAVAHMPEEHAATFERVTKVLRNGCLISASLEPAIPITYAFRHVVTG